MPSICIIAFFCQSNKWISKGNEIHFAQNTPYPGVYARDFDYWQNLVVFQQLIEMPNPSTIYITYLIPKVCQQQCTITNGIDKL